MSLKGVKRPSTKPIRPPRCHTTCPVCDPPHCSLMRQSCSLSSSHSTMSGDGLHMMMMTFICSCRNNNQRTAIYPLGTFPRGLKKEHVMMLPSCPLWYYDDPFIPLVAVVRQALHRSTTVSAHLQFTSAPSCVSPLMPHDLPRVLPPHFSLMQPSCSLPSSPSTMAGDANALEHSPGHLLVAVHDD
jgi:hypothetical protein